MSKKTADAMTEKSLAPPILPPIACHQGASRAGLWSSVSLDLDAERLCEQLDRLDDAVFAALNGCSLSLSEWERLWPLAVCSLNEELLEETRTHYRQWAAEAMNPTSPHFASGSDPLTARRVLALLDASHPGV